MDEGGRWRWGQRPRLRQQWPVGSSSTAADHSQITMTREHAGSGATMGPTSTERIGLSDAVAGGKVRSEMLHHPCQELDPSTAGFLLATIRPEKTQDRRHRYSSIFVSSKTRSAHSCSESESWPSVGIPRFFHFVIHHYFIISVLLHP